MTFDIEKRSEELFPIISVRDGTKAEWAYAGDISRKIAVSLAREALEAVEAKFRSRSNETDEVEAGEVWSTAADIIRSFIEKPGASPHPSGDSSDKAADNLGSRTAARTSQPPAPLSDADETAWLIELSSPGAPSMWLGRCGWTSPDFAVRFSREQDARDAYSLFARVPSPHVRFTEHVWCAKLRAAEEPDVWRAFFEAACAAQDSAKSSWNVGEAAREWFGPLLEYTRRMALIGDADAKAAIEDLRKRTA